MINNLKNRKGGFLELIIFIIVAFLLMRYFHITLTQIFDWLKGLFNSVR